MDFGRRVSTLHANAQRDLKRYLGLEGGEERILSWMTYAVDADPRLIERFGRDTRPIPVRPGSRYTNIQANVPPEKVVATFDAARAHGDH